MNRPGVRWMFAALGGWLYVLSLWVATSVPVAGQGGARFAVSIVSSVLALTLATLLLTRESWGRTGILLLAAATVLAAAVNVVCDLGRLQILWDVLSRRPWFTPFAVLRTQLDFVGIFLSPFVLMLVVVRPRAVELARSPGWIAVIVGLSLMASVAVLALSGLQR